MDQDLLYKYLSGEASEEETVKVLEWIELASENKQSYIELKKIWALTSKANVDTQKDWNNVNKRIDVVRNSSKKNLEFLKYASVAIVIFCVGYFVNSLVNTQEDTPIFAAETTFEAPVGQMCKVLLPDSTSVYLNSESKLVYSDEFKKGDRKVTLEGEAYFDVQTDKDHPFVIHTPSEISLVVYGTSFNVDAYPNGNRVEATLVEGSIGLLDKNGKELTKLVPGEKARYVHHKREIFVKKVDTDLYTTWKDGLVTFRDERFADIARKMERWYNVEFVIKSDELKNETYNGSIMKNKPLDQLLEVFKATSNIEFEIYPRPQHKTLIIWDKPHNPNKSNN